MKNWQDHDDSLEKAARGTIQVIQEAFDATTPQKEVTGSGYKWWNESCHGKKRDVTETRRTLRSLLQMVKAGATNLDTELDTARLHHTEAKKDLAKAISKPSKEFYQDLIANMTSLDTVQKAAKWLNLPQKTRSQAMMVDGVPHTSTQDKIRALREIHLTGSGLPDLDRPQVQANTGGMWQPVSSTRVPSGNL
ncbi:hypothetical protein Cpir12675_006481 [Ceratocystis pirilliformis]|uniref:Uncharacterized protein n=1 Tax=Ceratocystis pirilliformis TaxID=259994 RepID=A0ABR3YHL9_9PEZI